MFKEGGKNRSLLLFYVKIPKKEVLSLFQICFKLFGRQNLQKFMDILVYTTAQN